MSRLHGNGTLIESQQSFPLKEAEICPKALPPACSGVIARSDY
jgi:hypothetical protein